ncbi:Glycosyltransferase, GT2 family [Pseudomonas sp. ok272]|uniref:GT99 family glycosyltransferase N-terminal domain-containing protein n=1 Tax=unclassified Pseudomonas TaxID=196821 RepID=UPI0008C0FFCF|nr:MULTISPECIES: glycosyltransferase [unclassified Pseudomonas]SEN06249.1 Glycosyltransferase, GT2 family [Pseudomonas sp. ok272]SFN00226.1 Glycosyltransferase, GT2 family [Pseudomonas sp. ok602]
MIAVFLPPYAFRGVPAPYLWVFYRFLKIHDEKIMFIVGEEYLPERTSEQSAARWEFLESSQERLGYTIPTSEDIARHDLCFLSPNLFNEFLSNHNGNPNATFKELLTQQIPELTSEIETILSPYKGNLEAIITWCNCPSLSAAANKFCVPVIHLELGPLRDPDYQSTMYVDFSGVNGNTEAQSRYEALQKPINMRISTRQLLDYFLTKKAVKLAEVVDAQNLKIGIVHQVEDDSNLIAFGNGFDNRSTLSYAQLNFPINEILVRSHPGSLFQVKPGDFAVDESENSIKFIEKCKKLLTINSSVGLEALLQSKTVEVLGECSYKFIIEAESAKEQTDRLTFYLFAYLVPSGLAFDFNYIRFRIRTKNESDIVKYHLSHYSSDKNILEQKESLNDMIEAEVYAQKITNLNKSIDERNKTVDDLNKTVENLNQAIQSHSADLNTLTRKVVSTEQHAVLLSSAMRKENEELEKQLQDALQNLKAVERLLFISQAHVDGLLKSTSWSITRPLRAIRNQLYRIQQLKKAFSIARLHFGSPVTLGKKAFTIYRREGLSGVRARVKHLLESSSLGTQIPEHRARSESREIQRHASSVDIIVCVHNALSDVKNCLESINCYTLPPFRLIIVDDGSAAETQEFLSDYAKHQGCVIHRNEIAGGYTKAANCGLKLSDAEYSVLLNSDTIVTPYWLERLLDCANSDSKIGVVGPLSNTASWQSVPEIFDAKGDWTDNPLPKGLTIQEYADEIARESLRIYPKVGFINGFCFLIKRSLMAEIGIFDEEVFGRGYGEENDFCLRAAKAGWQLAIADDAYVYHAQSKSYSHERRMELSKAAGVNLANKHGQAIIDQQLNITANHPALEYIRKRTSLIEEKMETRKSLESFQGKRLLFVLPARTAGGGGNIILLEAAKLIANGVDAHIVNLRSNKEIFEANHPDNKVPTHYIYNPEELPDISQHFDAVIATLYLTVEWILPLVKQNSTAIFAYYIQDFEPNFFTEGSTEYIRAWNSYTLIDQMKLVTKTKWNRDILKQHLGVDCKVIGADFDDKKFHPDSVFRINSQSLTITAMVRPATPRRSPELTMRVLRRLKSTLGNAITIKTFGAEQSDPAYQSLTNDFQHECLGELNAVQVSELLRETDVFLDYSAFQAMGLTAMEASSSGAVNVGPINGGLSEVIIDDETGILVDTRDEEVCFIKTLEIIRDTQRRIDIGKKSLDMTKYYPEQAVLKLMTSLFNDHAGIQR